ncbi:MAG: hypothetical protein ACRDRL_27940 [Sciscionella sp.]
MGVLLGKPATPPAGRAEDTLARVVEDAALLAAWACPTSTE